MPLRPDARIDFSAFRKDALARLKRGLPPDAVFRCQPEPLVVEGSPADAILQTASREDARLIVMGIQARGALDRLIFGSTTRRVMQAATCPVLSIRASETTALWPASPAIAAARGEVHSSPRHARANDR
jgi:nucleotide-binding universal stress UspA family protein